MNQLPRAIENLFAAEDNRDWDTVRAALHPSVVWTIVDSEESRVEGADAYIARLRGAYEHRGASPFSVQRVRVGSSGRIMTELVDDHGNVSIDIFEIDGNGLITREWEHILGAPPE